MDACVYFICTEYDTASFRHYYDIGQQHKRISDSLIKILHGVYIVDGGLEYTVYPNLCPEQKTLNN